MEEEKAVVAKRTGQVLYKGTILKADHWLGGHQKSPVPFRLSGAPNFRTVPALPVSGVAQPSLFGIRAVLNRVFGRPNRIEQVVWCNLREEPVIYINARPFVLREFDHPLSNLTAYKGMSLSNLEDMEERLKADILAEASRYQGNLLVHDELDDECACPMWEAISSESVMTPREIFFTLQNEGYRVSYWRIPMNAEHFASHEAIDTFVDMVKSIDDQTHFVFNCQMGRGRSTMCTVMASLMYMWCRLINKPLAYRAEDDAEREVNAKQEEDILTSGEKKARVRKTPTKIHSYDRFVSYLDSANWKRASVRHSDIDGLASFRNGEYKPVMNLIRTLKYGRQTKQEVDLAIDVCELLQNLREVVLDYRLRYEQTRLPEESQIYLGQATTLLERYVYLIVFNAYLSEQAPLHFAVAFSAWLAGREEITSILTQIKADPNKALRITGQVVAPGKAKQAKGDLADLEEQDEAAGGRLVDSLDNSGDDVVRSRKGDVLSKSMMIKADLYQYNRAKYGESARLVAISEDVCNFRSADGYDHVHGVGQSSVEGTRKVISYLVDLERAKDPSKEVDIVWINLREEPIIFINSAPYVLRDAEHPFSNLGSFEGIAPDHLEEMEQRLKEDLLRECAVYGGKILVHDETDLQQVVSSWLTVAVNGETGLPAIETTNEVFAKVSPSQSTPSGLEGLRSVSYYRVPVTPERSPEEKDYNEFTRILTAAPENAHIVFNCQQGGGRSTVGMVAAVLIQMWSDLKKNGLPFVPGFLPGASTQERRRDRRGEYAAIMGLVRTLNQGQLLKQQLDTAIDSCASLTNVRDVVADMAREKKYTEDRTQQETFDRMCTNYLERYFYLLLFNSYLSTQTAAGFPLAFTEWVKTKSEIATLTHQMHANPQQSVKIVLHDQLQPTEAPAGSAVTADEAEADQKNKGLETASQAQREIEIRQAIIDRTGDVLVTNTILKADHFPGCQRKGLQPRLTGAPNFRRVEGIDVNVYGVAQCTIEGVVNLLDHLRTQPQRPSSLAATVPSDPTRPPTVVWTNLREEPIIYVNNRPFVVRQQDLPFNNLEITGIEPDEVEAMEQRLKADIIQDAAKYGGRVLIHEETDDGRLVGNWEEVTSETVLTLREVYESVNKRGYMVDYKRIPITDERAPEEKDFNELLKRLKMVTAFDHVVFNCQMGRGRTTTGMVVACMGVAHRYPELLPPPMELPSHLELEAQHETVPAALRGHARRSSFTPLKKELGISYHNGDYKIILRLIRVFSNGAEIKRRTDVAIDACSVMQNLRHAIKEYKVKTEEAHEHGNQAQYKFNKERAIAYLDRYFYLVAFNAYLSESDTNVKGFDQWMHERKELKSLLKEISLD